MTNAEATPPTQELPIVTAPAPASRRYRALVAAVRDHERVASHPAIPKRPADHALYTALASLEATPAGPSDFPIPT